MLYEDMFYEDIILILSCNLKSHEYLKSKSMISNGPRTIIWFQLGWDGESFTRTRRKDCVVAYGRAAAWEKERFVAKKWVHLACVLHQIKCILLINSLKKIY